MIKKNIHSQEYRRPIFQKRPQTLFIVIFGSWIVFIMHQIVFPAYAEPPKHLVPSYDILMTDDLKKKYMLKDFSCANRVYLYFTWYLLEDIHEVTAFWVGPHGKEENQVRLKFVAKKPKTNNWVALEFKNIFNDKNPITPSLKASKMNGKWKVRVLLDGNLLETRHFNIHCG